LDGQGEVFQLSETLFIILFVNKNLQLIIYRSLTISNIHTLTSIYRFISQTISYHWHKQCSHLHPKHIHTNFYLVFSKNGLRKY
jgi:hypothetical protein